MLRTYALVLALPALAVAQSPLETTFATPAPNTYVTATPSPITGLFDLNVTEPQGIVLTQVDLQVNALHGTNGQFGVWITAPGGTHVGAAQNPTQWTQVSSASAVHNGGRVSFILNPPVALNTATYGMAFHCIEANPLYHGGTASGTLPPTYSSTEMTIDMSQCRLRASDAIDPFGGAAGAGFSPRQMATGLYYTVGSTAVDFLATTTEGPSPLTVDFTAIAISGAPGGIQNYLWDFDNDGNPDSAAQNPQWVFPCGTHTVSLTIVDAAGLTTATKVDYIVTDVVTPSFTNQLVAPNTVQFTDTSTPTPTGWAWDFDNDGITDSTAQNPIFVFPNACDEAIVTLTTTLACKPPETVTRTLGVASTIETTFQGGLVTTGTALSSANYFDIDVTNPLGITVCGMHVNSSVAAGSPLTVNLYQTEGTYVGATGDASLWRLVASETLTSSGNRTFVPLSTPLHLATGAFGICMEHIGGSPAYTNLGPAGLVVTNADLTLTAGLSQIEPVFDPSSTTFSPRVVNIGLHYSTSGVTGGAGYGYIGSGCAGSLGVPTNVTSTQPVLGGAATITVNNLPFSVGAMTLGSVRTAPVDLGFVGMPGCRLHHNALVLQPMVGVANSATFVFTVPNNPTFIGVQIFTQAATVDPGINAAGFGLSDAAVLLVGQ